MKARAARSAPLILCALALGLVFTSPATAEPNAAKGETEPSLLVDADYVRRYQRQNPGLQLVDVRSSRAFKETHIPGSVNVPLSLVPHKSFLQSGTVILVGSGAKPGPLLTTCRELRRNGVRASVLWGGLAAWGEAGGSLTGKRRDRRKLNEVSPAAFYRQRGRDYWQVLYVGDKRPQGLHKFLPEAEFRQRGELASHLEASEGPRLILLVTRTGEGYNRLESLLREKGIANAFCLKGGLTAYAPHLKARRNIEEQEVDQTAARSECSNKVQPISSDICSECGE